MLLPRQCPLWNPPEQLILGHSLPRLNCSPWKITPRPISTHPLDIYPRKTAPQKILLKISVHGLSHLNNFPWTTILCTNTTPWNSFQDNWFPYFFPILDNYLWITFPWIFVPMKSFYPITPFLSPPRIYVHGLKSEFKPTGLNTDPFSALEKIQKHCRCNFFFSIKY